MKKKSQVSWTKRVTELIKHQYSLNNPQKRRQHYPSRHQRILDQIKFYFSDANLRRDKYMHALFEEDPLGWISIGDLRAFPILKYLKVSESEVIEACASTDFFILDLPTHRVRRNFEAHPNLEILDQLNGRSAPGPGQCSLSEKRTVYIDRVPISMNVDQLRDELRFQFPPFAVLYVSIPRHPMTGEGLGGAFVEFGSEDEARIVVRKLRHLGQSTFTAHSAADSITAMSFAKFKALKNAYKVAKSTKIKNRLQYFLAYCPDESAREVHQGGESQEIRGDRGEDESDAKSLSTSSLLSDSDINSLAQDSVEVRRRISSSSIRSDSVILVSNIPPTKSLNVRVWLSHSSSVQFLDHRDGDSTAYVRFASRRERDFFLKDVYISRTPLLGQIPVIRALSVEECVEYFEAERDRRRASMQSMGHPDSWQPQAKKPRIGAFQENPHTTLIPVVRGWTIRRPSNGFAFTDTVAGNARFREPGSSLLFRIKKGRHVAREKFLSVLESLRADRHRSHHSDDLVRRSPESPGLAAESRSPTDFLPERSSRVKRRRDPTPQEEPSKSARVVGAKKTRRGKRGGKHQRVNQRVPR